MKLRKRIMVFMTIVLGLGGMLFNNAAVFAEDYGLGDTAGAAGLKSSRTLPQLVGDIIGTGLSFISVIFFMLMIYGGFLWMTARGNSDMETKAKDTIFGAVIGIIIVLAAYALTSFVFKSLGPGGDPSTAGNGGGSQCDIHYGSKGLSCNNKTACDDTKAGLVDPIYQTVQQGTYTNGNAFIVGMCPGGNNIVCCIKK